MDGGLQLGNSGRNALESILRVTHLFLDLALNLRAGPNLVACAMRTERGGRQGSRAHSARYQPQIKVIH